MRTTVTLDPDVEALLRQAMRERSLSFKEALNAAVRAGLGPAGVPGRPQRRYRIKPVHMGFDPTFRWDKALALAGELEDDAIARKLEQRK